MKKIIYISVILTAFMVICMITNSSAMSEFELSNPARLLKVDSRDAMNRKVHSTLDFETSAFFRIYSMFASFGVNRFVTSNNTTAESISAVNNFKLPIVISSFLYSGRRISLNFSEHILAESQWIKTWLFLLTLFAAFAASIYLSKGTEPRFRLPILIE